MNSTDSIFDSLASGHFPFSFTRALVDLSIDPIMTFDFLQKKALMFFGVA